LDIQDPQSMHNFDVDGSSTGYRTKNNSPQVVMGMRVRVVDESNFRFDMAHSHGGAVFPWQEIRDGGKEVIFGGGAAVLPNEKIWSRFPDAVDANGDPILYRGTALTTDPAPPGFLPFVKSNGQYSKAEKERQEIWRGFLRQCPMAYRKLQATGISNPARYLCVVSTEGVLLYDRDRQLLVVPVVYFPRQGAPVNDVTFEQEGEGRGRFFLWDRWMRLTEISVEALDDPASHVLAGPKSAKGKEPTSK
jgi:hypothetical protein